MKLSRLQAAKTRRFLKKQAEKFKPRYTVLGEEGLEKICTDKENDIISSPVRAK